MRSAAHAFIDRRGFTLVELLVVIAIVGILMAILLPTLEASREQGRRLRCGSNVRTLVFASINYSSDYGANVPDGGWGYVVATMGPYGRYCFDARTRRLLYLNYGASNPAMWWCPNSGRRPGSYLRYTSGLRDVFFSNNYTTTDNNTDLTGYGYFVGYNRGFTGASAITYQMPYVKRFSDPGALSTRIVWAEPMLTPGADSAGFNPWLFPVNNHDTAGNRAQQGGMQAYADGHAGWRGYAPGGVNFATWVAQGFLYADAP